jgi:hypothetical protein
MIGPVAPALYISFDLTLTSDSINDIPQYVSGLKDQDHCLTKGHIFKVGVSCMVFMTVPSAWSHFGVQLTYVDTLNATGGQFVYLPPRPTLMFERIRWPKNRVYKGTCDTDPDTACSSVGSYTETPPPHTVERSADPGFFFLSAEKPDVDWIPTRISTPKDNACTVTVDPSGQNIRITAATVTNATLPTGYARGVVCIVATYQYRPYWNPPYTAP